MPPGFLEQVAGLCLLTLILAWASAITGLTEIHHFYPVLCYFRFTSALPRLRHAGIEVTDDVDAGVAAYVRLREGWEGPVVAVAGLLGYTREQIDASM